MRIPLSNVNLSSVEVGYVNDALLSEWISGTGGYVTRFEAALAEKIGCEYVIATANGTLGLVLALQGLGVGVGDEVIVPAFTFAAPAAAVKLVGATPVFVDVHPVSWTIDPGLVEERLSPRTAAVIAVDVIGHPADYNALRQAVGTLPIIQDAAEAHGSEYCGRAVGSQGDVSVFSFHANKAISTGEGGAVLTDDAELAAQMRLIANHGMSAPYWHNVVGCNYRMSNLVAAVGLGQVQRWDYLIDARDIIAERYDELLPESIGRRLREKWATLATWLYCVLMDNRDEVLIRLNGAGVDARAVWRPLPEMPPYRDGRDYPVAQSISDRALFLPTWAGMRRYQVEAVTCALVGDKIAT